MTPKPQSISFAKPDGRLLLSAPLLVIGFAVGIVMNMIQMATSLQDSAFSTFPGWRRSC